MDQHRMKQPGAARFGNFPDYYSFNPSCKRLKYITDLCLDDIKHIRVNDKIKALDIGCNTGELTVELVRWLRDLYQSTENQVQCVGLDIDEELVMCASRKYKDICPEVTFRAVDMMNDQSCYSATKYDITFCFSVTLWIHINHGDEGLKQFLKTITCASHTTYLIMEAQPWKCYRTAARRAKRANQPSFPYYDSLTVRGNITEFINDYITGECKMTKVKELGTTDWGRKIVLYFHDKT